MGTGLRRSRHTLRRAAHVADPHLGHTAVARAGPTAATGRFDRRIPAGYGAAELLGRSHGGNDLHARPVRLDRQRLVGRLGAGPAPTPASALARPDRPNLIHL